MKKRGVVHTALAKAMARIGHGDLLIIAADAGLPVFPGVPCIHLAVRCGLPAMLEVTQAVAEERRVEK